jgi:hypothetical protein
MVSRTSAASFSAPLRKSTGLVATITRTAPVGPITCRLSMHAAPPSKSLRPRHGRPGLSRRDLDLDRSGTGFGFAIRRPPLLNRKRFPHPQLPARTATCQPQNVQPQILAIDVASQTTAAAITMASSYRTDRVSARRDPGDNPGLVFIAPCPPPGAYGTLRVHGDCESKGRLAMSWRQVFGIGICICLFGSGVWANVNGGSLSQNTGSWVSHSR